MIREASMYAVGATPCGCPIVGRRRGLPLHGAQQELRLLMDPYGTCTLHGAKPKWFCAGGQFIVAHPPSGASLDW